MPGRVNIAVFHNDLKDMQLQIGYNSASSGPTTGIVNAGEAEINGFEVEAYFQLFEPLSLSISYSQLDTELLKQSDVDPADVERAVTEASGNPLSGQIAASTFVPIAAEGDEQYLTYVSGTYVATGIESRQVGFPKMYGARLRYSF